MGDISRHRDIFLNTREAIPTDLLNKCKLTVADLTYLEMGNFLTDVSQFRDPVFYIFAKQRVWRESIIPGIEEKVEPFRVGSFAATAAGALLLILQSGKLGSYLGGGLAGLGWLSSFLLSRPDMLADFINADGWIDRMFGKPLPAIPDIKNEEKKLEVELIHYGYVGQFFRYFIGGIMHLIFADNISNKVGAGGSWGMIDRISESNVTAIFKEFFTQYYPHEHTDQPPYIWDASKRSKDKLYQPSTRQQTLVDIQNKVVNGVMNAVDKHYVQYLSEGLSDLEHEWYKIDDKHTEERHKWLVRLGKILHGIEDWYFHSNVVELIRLRGHKPTKDAKETDEEFLKRFVQRISESDPEFVNTQSTEERTRLERRLYRRLRFPIYNRGDRYNSGGIPSTSTSILSLDHAYPAFPSQQDTAHTIIPALDNLEQKIVSKIKMPSSRGTPVPGTWLQSPLARCIRDKYRSSPDGRKLFEDKTRARAASNMQTTTGSSPSAEDIGMAITIDVFRELLPLVVTLLDESERRRLIMDVEPLKWPVGDTNPVQQDRKDWEKGNEIKKQFKRHKKALEPILNQDGFTENNYQRAARYLVDCGCLNASGQQALSEAFKIDLESQRLSNNLSEEAPGSGMVLMTFALRQQELLDEGEIEIDNLNKKKESIFDPASDNKAFEEIIGSHSLMSKDTLKSPPFFDDAKVLASVASSSVFQIMLEQISKPQSDRRIPWEAILHYFIRFPPTTVEWERRAMAFFRDPKNNGKIPRFTDLPELAGLVESALASKASLNPWSKGTKDNELKQRYIKLESELSNYRHP